MVHGRHERQLGSGAELVGIVLGVGVSAHEVMVKLDRIWLLVESGLHSVCYWRGRDAAVSLELVELVLVKQVAVGSHAAQGEVVALVDLGGLVKLALV